MKENEMSDTAESGTVRIVVKNIDKLNDELIFGPTVTISGLPWCLGVRLSHVSRKSLSAPSTTWASQADFCIRLLSNQVGNFHEEKTENEFNYSDTDLGFEPFIGWKEMSRKGFVQGKAITLEADIDVKWAYNLQRKKTFKTFREADETTNAILLVEGQQLHVNRDLLTIYSPFFKTLFFSDFHERTLKEIPLQDVKAAEFVELLQVLYPPHKNITAENVEVILKLADRYGIEVLVEKCEVCLHLCSTLPIAKKILLADTYNLKELLCRFVRSLKSLDEVKALREAPEFNQLNTATKFLIVDKGLAFSNK